MTVPTGIPAGHYYLSPSYYMRGIDSATGTYVYWFWKNATDVPTAGGNIVTMPALAGSIVSNTQQELLFNLNQTPESPTGMILNVNLGAPKSILPFSMALRVSSVQGIPPIGGLAPSLKVAFFPSANGPGPGVTAGGETYIYTGSVVIL